MTALPKLTDHTYLPDKHQADVLDFLAALQARGRTAPRARRGWWAQMVRESPCRTSCLTC